MQALGWFLLAAVLLQLIGLSCFASVIIQARRRAHASAGPLLMAPIYAPKAVGKWRLISFPLGLLPWLLAGYFAFFSIRNGAASPVFALGVTLMVLGMVMHRRIMAYLATLPALELHENGVVCRGSLVPWRDIHRFKWRHSGSETAQLYIQFPDALYEVAIDPAVEQQANGILAGRGIPTDQS